MDFSSLLFLNLSAAAIARGADLDCQVFMYLMLTGGEFYFVNVQRGEGEKKRENQSLW